MVEALEGRALLSISVHDVSPAIFRSVPGATVTATLVADLNADGKQDLVIATSNGEVVSLRGRGDGTFRAPRRVTLRGPDHAAAFGVGDLQAGDFDGDGRLDIAAGGVVNRRSGAIIGTRVWLLRGDGAGGLARAGMTRDAALHDVRAVFDTNGDGRDDLVENRFFLLTGASSGNNIAASTFVAGRVVDLGPLIADSRLDAFAWSAADFDADGRVDLLVSSLVLPESPASTVVLYNGGSAGWTAEVIAVGHHFTAAHDLDGDGRPEALLQPPPFLQDGVVHVLAARNSGGQFDQPVQTLFEAPHETIRGWGGHSPEVPEHYAYSAEWRIDEVRDFNMDSRLDLSIVISTEQSYTGQGFEDTFNFVEEYRLVLLAPDTGTPDTFPVYEPELPALIEFDGYQHSRGMEGITRGADFDGDGHEDRILTRGSVSSMGSDHRSLVYVELAAARHPISLDPMVLNPAAAGQRRVARPYFETPADRTIVRAALFLDTNTNGRLDAGDERISQRTTPVNGRWKLPFRVKVEWGTGPRTLFCVGQDNLGIVSIPMTAVFLLT